MVEEAASASILFGVSGSDLALAALQPNGAALIEVAWTCAEVEGPNFDTLRNLESSKLFGPKPAIWSGTRILERLEALRADNSNTIQNCSFFTHANSDASDRRRRYWWESKRLGEGFLGREGGGVFSELARQRNL